MKKSYIAPEAEVVNFYTEDEITSEKGLISSEPNFNAGLASPDEGWY